MAAPSTPVEAGSQPAIAPQAAVLPVRERETGGSRVAREPPASRQVPSQISPGAQKKQHQSLAGRHAGGRVLRCPCGGDGGLGMCGVCFICVLCEQTLCMLGSVAGLGVLLSCRRSQA